MITIKLGPSDATLVDRTWSSTSTSLRNMLQAFTDGLSIHGGTPNVEQAIVDAAATSFPLTLVGRDSVDAGSIPINLVF